MNLWNKYLSSAIFDKKGYTLIELIVVIVLIGIFLAIGMPSFREQLFSDSLNSTARKIIAIVSNVRLLAVEDQVAMQIIVNRREKRLWFEVLKEEDQGNIIRRKEQKYDAGIDVSLLDKGNITLDEKHQFSIDVSPKGYIKETTIALIDNDGKKLYVKFFPFIAKPEISDSIIEDED